MSPLDIESIRESSHHSGRTEGVSLSDWVHSYRSPVTFKAVLAVGHLALATAVIFAYLYPATGYELSIYAGSHTPLSFWFGTGLGLLASLIVALYSRQARARFLALVLGGACMAAVVGLPLIRGYYFYGQTDPLIHLGWTRAIAAGSLSVMSVLYPGAHVSAIIFGDVTGFAIRQSMMLLVVAFAAVFFMFVPMAARLLVDDRLAVTIAAFSGFMLLPLNNVSTFLRFHPLSLTLLFLPLAFYLLLRHLHSRNQDIWGLASGTGLTFLMVGSAVLLFHPQVMLNFLIMLGVIAAYQVYHRRKRAVGSENRLGRVTGHFLLLGLLFFVWISDHWQLYTTIEQTLAALPLIGRGGAVGQVVQQRTSSASSIGANLSELFVKLFGVSVIYLTLAGAYVVQRVKRSDGGASSPQTDIYKYLFYGGLALVPLVVVHFLGKVSTYFFRYVGFVMVFGTILGAIAIRHYAARFVTDSKRISFRPAVAAVLVIGLMLSVAALYPSPFVYLPNHHVTEAQMEGYGTAFEHQPPGATVWFGGIRTTSNRYESALIDAPPSVWSGSVPGPAIANIREYYRTHEEEVVRRDHYFVVTTYGFQREVYAYNQLRYTATEIQSIEDRPGVHRIHSNGEFTLYYVDINREPDQ